MSLTLDTVRGTYRLDLQPCGKLRVTHRSPLGISAAIAKQIQRPQGAARLLAGYPPKPEYTEHMRHLNTPQEAKAFFKSIPLSAHDRARVNRLLEELRS